MIATPFIRVLAIWAVLYACPVAAQATATTSPAVMADHGDIATIDDLDAAALAAGTIHRFWFRVSDTALAQHWLVPVIVIRGDRPGPRLLLTAAVHGDELNGIDVVQQLAAQASPATLSGTLVMVPGLNTPGLMNGTRNFSPRGGDGDDNLNRMMPGSDAPGARIGARYAHRLWHGLLRPNADAVIDLHTQSRGTAYVFYAFAGTARARGMAALIAPDVLRLDPGQDGTIETEMNKAGVPAITLEIGRPDIFDAAMNLRAINGIRRVMADMGMIVRASAPARPNETFVANNQVELRTDHGGFVRLLAPLGQRVVVGQPVATVSDAFGRVIETLRAPVAGIISTTATNPLRDAGSMVMRIAFVSDDPACREGC